MPIPNHVFIFILAGTAGGLASFAVAPLAAQGRAVVQPLPPAATSDLTRALSRLARNPQDTDALILAGNASLELDDVDAAIGFFGRADELSPNNPRVKSGTAAAYVRVRRPVEALRLFEEAERAGIRPIAVAGDKGLALDLVGSNREAQLAYRRSLAHDDNSEVRRRMALSFAIAGDSEGFESTLLPLLNQRDLGAYRTRAFGLAILGKPDEAVAIAEAVMPADMAERVEPYLRYMRRLTPAQQAAAGNLGIFPRAAAIGRDDPRIAAARSSGSGPAIAGIDSGLAPSGRPLGQPVEAAAPTTASAQTAQADQSTRLTRAQRRALRAQASDPSRRARGRIRVAQAAPASASTPQPAASSSTPPAPTVAAVSEPATGGPVAAAPSPVRRTERGELPALAGGELPPRFVNPEPATVASAPVSSPVVPDPTSISTSTPGSNSAVQAMQVAEPVQIASAATAQVANTPAAGVAIAPVVVAASEVATTAASVVGPPEPAATGDAVTVAVLDAPAPAAVPAPGFDLGVSGAASTSSIEEVVLAPSGAETSADLAPATTVTPGQGLASASPTVAPSRSEAASTTTNVPQQSLSQAFSDLMALPGTLAAAPSANAVDIFAIDIPREQEAAAQAEEAAAEASQAAANASRIWVQVATGRDRSALGFDWRRFSRQAPDVLKDNGPFVVSWGQTNRLLAGPYDNNSDANTAVSALADKGIGAFRFTSDDGQEIDRLGR